MSKIGSAFGGGEKKPSKLSIFLALNKKAKDDAAAAARAASAPSGAPGSPGGGGGGTTTPTSTPIIAPARTRIGSKAKVRKKLGGGSGTVTGAGVGGDDEAGGIKRPGARTAKLLGS